MFYTIVLLAWRANHLEEMIDWIRLQVEIPVYLSSFFFLLLSKAMLFGKENMDFFNDKIKLMYLKYLAVHFFSSIYSVVDMAVVGKYQGLDDAAVLALVSPIWNIIYSLGLLIGSRYYRSFDTSLDILSRYHIF